MKIKKLGIDYIVIIAFYLILPLIMWLANPMGVMGITYIQYVYIGPFLSFVIGVVYGLEKKRPEIIVVTMIICCAITLFLIITEVTKVIIITPIIAMYIGHAIGYVRAMKKEK